jgi:triacylglycerol lipase
MKIIRDLRLTVALIGLLLLAACRAPLIINPSSPELGKLPIVFVHGNGDSAALWQTTVWRFETNGWPRDMLYAIDLPYPLARDDDTKPQPGRTSSAEHMAYLKSEVNKVLARTGAEQVVLMANSRGGYAVRNFIQNGGGDRVVSHAILGGTPNHGVWAIPGFREGSEFSGTGPFLTALNAPKNALGHEEKVSTLTAAQTLFGHWAGVRWMTIRSDNNDKFAQPDGLWIGQKGTPTFVTYAGPELKGATNVVIPRIDHRETSFSPAAFEASYRFITGHAPRTLAIERENEIILSGKVTGLGLKSDDPLSGNFVNNLPITNAKVEAFMVDPLAGERFRTADYSAATGADGAWGPLRVRPNILYEFVITAPGYATTHIYRWPLPRSSTIVHLRAERLSEADKNAAGPYGSIVTLSRPRGYIDLSRDKVFFDEKYLPVEPPSAGAGLSTRKIIIKEYRQQAVRGAFNDEELVGRTWLADQNHVVILEITQ